MAEARQEQAISIVLRALAPDAAKTLEKKIRALTNRQSERAFCNGVRFGARLMIQLLADIPC